METMAGDINSTRLATGSKVKERVRALQREGNRERDKEKREVERERGKRKVWREEGDIVCGNTLMGTADVAPFFHIHLFLPFPPFSPSFPSFNPFITHTFASWDRFCIEFFAHL